MRPAARLLAAILPILVLLAVQGPALWRLAGEPRLPQWDMAKYGVSGLRLAGSLATLDLPGLAGGLNELSVWPPLFPLYEAPFFLAFGKSETVAARAVLLLWFASLLLLPWALAPLSERRSPAAGWLAAAALAAGTLYGSFATLVMLEVPGIFLQVLAIGFTLRALRGEPGAWRAAYLACALLFFCKYNYGLLYIVPLLLFRVRLGVASWPAAKSTLLRHLRAIDWFSPGPLALGLAGLVVAAIQLGGGFEVEIFGRLVSLGSIGNPLLILLWLGVLGALWGRRRRQATWARLAALDRETQGLLRYLGAPILVWLLLPPHLKDFLDFVENRSSQLPFLSEENLLFYPRVFFEQLAPSPVFGVLILIFALLGLRHLGGSVPLSFLGLWTVIGAAAVVVHPYKQDRFFLHTGFALVVLAAVTCCKGLDRLPARWRKVPVAPLVAALLAVAGSAIFGFGEAGIRREVALRSVPAEVGEVLDAVVAARRAEPALLLGTWNLASPWLVEWRAWQSSGSWSAPLLPLLPGDLARRRNGAALAARLAQGPPLVLRIEPLAEDPAYAAETAWLAPALARLDDPALYAAEPPRVLPGAAYRLSSWRRR